MKKALCFSLFFSIKTLASEAHNENNFRSQQLQSIRNFVAIAKPEELEILTDNISSLILERELSKYPRQDRLKMKTILQNKKQPINLR